MEAVHETYGPVSVIHFDAHIDTWNPNRYMGQVSLTSNVNHGTFFWAAYEQGFIRPNSSIHAGIRTRFAGPQDLDDDVTAGFDLVHTMDVDDYGVDWIARKIKERIGSNPVVISLDVDVMDPSFVPATGTPESGGKCVVRARGSAYLRMEYTRATPNSLLPNGTEYRRR